MSEFATPSVSLLKQMIVEGRVVSLVQVCLPYDNNTHHYDRITKFGQQFDHPGTWCRSWCNRESSVGCASYASFSSTKHKKRECTRPVFKKGERQEVASNYGKPPRLAVDHGNTNRIPMSSHALVTLGDAYISMAQNGRSDGHRAPLSCSTAQKKKKPNAVPW